MAIVYSGTEIGFSFNQGLKFTVYKNRKKSVQIHVPLKNLSFFLLIFLLPYRREENRPVT